MGIPYWQRDIIREQQDGILCQHVRDWVRHGCEEAQRKRLEATPFARPKTDKTIQPVELDTNELRKSVAAGVNAAARMLESLSV